MAKYDVTYGCGHTDTVDLGGRADYRQWKLSKLENELCPECQKIAFYNTISKYEEEYALPELSGTEKQIKCARKIRYNILKKLEADNKKEFKDYAESHGDDEAREKEYEFLSLFYKQARASWWFDRKESEHVHFMDYCDDPAGFIERYELEPFMIENEVELKDTPTIYPEGEKTNTICHIYSCGSDGDPYRMIYVKSDKDDVIIDVLHGIHGMKWNYKKGIWEFKWAGINVKLSDTATYDDMLVCIGYRMLSRGVPVSSDRNDLYQRMINGDYEKRCFNWLTVRDGELVYVFANYDYDIAYRVKRIKGTKYDSAHRRYILNPAYYAGIRDWADDCGVKISESAENLLKQAEERYLGRNVVTIAEKMPEGKTDKIAEILNSPTDILDDLLISN